MRPQPGKLPNPGATQAGRLGRPGLSEEGAQCLVLGGHPRGRPPGRSAWVLQTDSRRKDRLLQARDVCVAVCVGCFQLAEESFIKTSPLYKRTKPAGSPRAWSEAADRAPISRTEGTSLGGRVKHRGGVCGPGSPAGLALAPGVLSPSHAVRVCAERVGCRRTCGDAPAPDPGPALCWEPDPLAHSHQRKAAQGPKMSQPGDSTRSEHTCVPQGPCA